MPRTPLTDAEIAELRRLDAEAEPAPWEPDRASRFLICGDEAVRDVWQEDEEKRNEGLACAGRNALPRLLDEVERARALLKRIEWAGEGEPGDEAGRCPECHGQAHLHISQPKSLGHAPNCELAALIGGK